MKTVMKKYLKLIIVTAVLVGCDPFSQTDIEVARSPITVLLDDQIQPRYAHLVSQAAILREHSAGFCHNAENREVGLLQQQWRNTMLSWQAVAVVSELMLEENMDGWRMQFWPDKKNLVGRKIETRLKNKTPVALMSDSVILQGLSATEYLLFDAKAEPALAAKKAEYCRFLLDNTTALHTNASELMNNWQPAGSYYQKLMLLKQQENALAFWVLNSLDSQTTRLKKELGLPLGKQRSNPLLAESWRSGQSLANIRTVLATFAELIAVAADAKHMKELAHEVSDLSLTMQKLPDDFTTAFSQGKENELRKIQQQLNRLSEKISKTANSLGVPLGFNASDGD